MQQEEALLHAGSEAGSNPSIVMRAEPDVSRMVVALAVCNDSTRDLSRVQTENILSYSRQLTQVNVLLKSIVLYTRRPVHVALVCDSAMTCTQLLRTLHSWPPRVSRRLSFSRHAMPFPNGTAYLKYLNRPCAASRHFYPAYFPSVDRLISLDTDVVLLTDLERLWEHLDSFNSTQVFGGPAMFWAERDAFRQFPKPPHAGLDDGINIGVSVVSLNAWRKQFWPFRSYLERLHTWYRRYGTFYQFPTQDLFNTWLGLYPHLYYDLPCGWNMRLMYFRAVETNPCNLKARIAPSAGPLCPGVARHGPLALHGAGGHFTDGTPGFSDIFNAILQLRMDGHDPQKELRHRLLKLFRESVLEAQRETSASASWKRKPFARRRFLETLLRAYLPAYSDISQHNGTGYVEGSESGLCVGSPPPLPAWRKDRGRNG